MKSTRYPFGTVLPEIRDLLVSSESAIKQLDDSAAEFEVIGKKPYQNFSAHLALQTKIYDLVSNDQWTIKLSFLTGAGRIMATATDNAAIITGNIIRVGGTFPATLVSSLPGKPLRTLVETGLAAADNAIIDSASEAESTDGSEKYLVVTIKVRTVVIPRNRSKQKALARKALERSSTQA